MALHLRRLLRLFLILIPYSASAQTTLPKPVAEIAINYHLASRLADECKTEIDLDTRKATQQLRAVLAKENMTFSENGFSVLLNQIGRELVFGAEGVYFEQMDISHFDRQSFCKAAGRAIKEEQAVGEFLKISSFCRRKGSSCAYFQ